MQTIGDVLKADPKIQWIYGANYIRNRISPKATDNGEALFFDRFSRWCHCSLDRKYFGARPIFYGIKPGGQVIFESLENHQIPRDTASAASVNLDHLSEIVPVYQTPTCEDMKLYFFPEDAEARVMKAIGSFRSQIASVTLIRLLGRSSRLPGIQLWSWCSTCRRRACH